MIFEEIAQRLEGALGRANGRLQGKSTAPSEQRELLAESVEEFSAALEQLQVIDEEMRRQNDELIATRAAVEAERRRYQELFELAPGGYVVTDSVGVIREANYAAKMLLGVPRHKLEGKPLVVFVDKDHRRDFRLRLAAMQRADQPEEWEIRLRPRKGDQIEAALKCVPVHDGRGNLAGLRWLLRDITERKRVQEAVLESERRLRKQTWALRRLASCHRRNLDDLDGVLKEITETAADALDLERTSIWLFNEDCSLIRCADLFELTTRTHSNGFELEAARHPRYFKALEVQRAIAAHDACADPRTAEFAESYFSQLGITSVLDAPIRLGGKLVGVIWHEHVGTERRWTLEEENFAGSIAESVSLILEAREHKRAEEALRRSEEKYRLLVENIPDVTWWADSRGRTTFVSPNLERVLGYTPEEISEAGGRWLSRIHPSDVSRVQEEYEALFTSGSTFDCEYRILTKDDRWVWIHNRAVTTRETNGVRYAFGLLSDITDRKRDQEELRKSETRLAEAQQIAHVGSWEWDLASDEAMWSDETFRIFGLAPQSIQSTYADFLERVHSNDRQHVKRVLAKAIANHGRVTLDYRILLPDKTVRMLHVRGEVILDDSGRPIRMVGSVQDITEIKQAEYALRASEERYRVFVEQSSEAIWRFELDEPIPMEGSEDEKIDHAYRHAYLAECNDVMAKMYGLTSAREIVGRRLGELLDRRDSRNIDYLRNFFRSGYRVADAESHEVDAAGDKRYFLNNLVGVLEEGGLVRAWGTQRDITGQRNTEEEIHVRNRQLAALNATSAAVSGSLELSSVLATLKKLLVEQMEIPSGGIYLYDEADDLFYLQAAWGLPDQMVSKLKTYPATGFYGDQMMLQPDAILSLEFGESSSFPLPVDDGEERQWQSYLRVPLIAKGQIQGIAALLGAEPSLLSSEQISFFKALGQQVGVAIQNARLFEQVSAARERMRTLSQRLVQVQEAERRHIARELHDQVGQALTGLIFELEVCRRLPPADLDRRINKAQELANELIAQVRNLSLILRPTILDDLGLLPALLWHFERYTDSTGVRVSFDYAGLERRFPAEVETAAYRVAQEALTNVARHAEVREATVHVWADMEMLCVQVEDRGAGFDAKAAIEKHASSGVAGMRERALLLGGELNIESAPGRGARLTAEFPLNGGMWASEKSSSVST